MAFKITVEDRISTYPGRVKLVPVAGEANTYDMERADVPITEGTPINKRLFDSKADVLFEDTTVYVTTNGDDSIGDGTEDAPFGTIQFALDALPKNLGGHTVTIDIAPGTYDERFVVKGFAGGKIVLGVSGRNVIVRGIEVIGSSIVEINISNITKTAAFGGPLLFINDGGNVFMGSSMTIEGIGDSVSGVSATNGSTMYAEEGTTLKVSNCYGAAVIADLCSLVSLDTITGNDNVIGVGATRGGIISYKTETMANMWGNNADSGGLVLTGSNSSELSGATLDL
jgi:hypothetical protein